MTVQMLQIPNVIDICLAISKQQQDNFAEPQKNNCQSTKAQENKACRGQQPEVIIKTKYVGNCIHFHVVFIQMEQQ